MKISAKKNLFKMYMDDSVDSDTSLQDLTGSPEEVKKVSINNMGKGSGQKPVEVEPVKETEKLELYPDEMMEVQAEKGPPNLKEMIEVEMKGLMGKVMALETHQEQGGAQLLAKAAALQKEVSAYKEKLANTKEEYRDRVNRALSCFSTTTQCSIH